MLRTLNVPPCFCLCAESMILSSFQHIIALVGSMIIVPMILVPRMGGSDVSS